MKKKIIFGSLFAIFLMMMLPSVPAVEYNTAVEANELRILDELQNIDLKELKVKIQNIDIKSIKEELKDNPALPQCFAIPYAIIALIILCLIFGVLGAIGVTVGLILSVIISLVVGVLGAIGAIVGLIIKIVVALITDSIAIISKIASLILNIIVTMKDKLSNLLIVTLGVILDILRLIYDAIFPGITSAA